jgi:putative transposase
MKIAAERLMKVDVEVLCGARYGARRSERMNSRNGFRMRLWSTPSGTINLAIPKLRRGSYFPDWLVRPFGTSLLLAFVNDCLVNGVSVRKTGVLVRVLGLSDIPDSDVAALAAALDEILVSIGAG